MLAYVPKSITNKSIVVYILLLCTVTIAFYQYSMQWYFVVFGILEVVGFFYFSNQLSIAWARISLQSFRKHIFKTALVIRLIYVVFSYFFFTHFTGKPFEFEAADSLTYHGMATDAIMFYSQGRWNLFKEFPDMGVSDSGYPYFLSLQYLLFGPVVVIPRIVKALLGAYMSVLIYKIASRNFGESVGRIAAIFIVLCPHLVYYCGVHLKEIEMVFISTFFIERLDAFIREPRYTAKNISILILSFASLFLFRTVLALSVGFAAAFSIILANHRVMSMKKKWQFLIISGLFVLFFLGGKIATEVNEIWQKRHGQKADMEWRSEREGGNEFAKYAGAAVFAPLIFSIPFPTMIEIPTQEVQQMVNGNNYIKNILSFFVIFSMFMMLKNKRWKEHTVILSFMLSYLIILALSQFAQSERFHLPVLPIELIFAAFGIVNLKPKYRSYFPYWLVFMFIVGIAWNWFKLAGRNLI